MKEHAGHAIVEWWHHASGSGKVKGQISRHLTSRQQSRWKDTKARGMLLQEVFLRFDQCHCHGGICSTGVREQT